MVTLLLAVLQKESTNLPLLYPNVAHTIDRTKDGFLTRFFKPIAYKKGRGAAITARARKRAVIIWNRIVKKGPYKPIDTTVYQHRVKAQKLASIKKQMAKAANHFRATIGHLGLVLPRSYLS
ncbi:MAG: hypothetical protein AAF620_15210 [Bacteroidota bacterium]